MQNPNPSSSSPPSPPWLDSAPFIHRSRHLLRRAPPPLHTAATFFRRASGRRMMLREPSVRVREAAAAEVEGRQSEWAYSRPVVALDVAWNAVFLAIGASVLALSTDEDPCVPLRAWIVGYLLQGALHSLCVVAEFTRRRRRRLSGTHPGSNVVGHVQWSFSSESDEEFYPPEQFLEGDGNSITKHIETVNTMLSFIWWIVGFYWVTAGGQSLTRDSPQLYWLCITFLAFDVVIVLICVSVACLIGIAVCCCLPCILAILYVVADPEGATKEEIDQLPKYKFRIIKEFKKEGDIEESSRGIMTETESETAAEHVIALEDAECCICLSAYDNGAELRELPCNHHFHCTCIDKWLLINATCPLCKFNILRTGNHYQEV
ncbi:E3 ubiquitin-protein ligase At1g63170-like [Glycine soja]|uniref:RING-type E3 ubiquitin transferase n=2 Tax=Glycine soja TaxID=3848 RepID=A0A445FXI1_GLYSO|nr:E3 ubiquitin-protein ligase At1g63170-like [Glycine soja]RZB53611.1 E3 ubiquitin-protein ligase isoform A [Glycine soja]